MKGISKSACIILALLFMGIHTYGQNEQPYDEQGEQAYEQSEQKTYLGFGFGMDYGGLGGKIEYLPVKNFGIFGGLGFNLSSVGWNVGATLRLLPGSNISPNLIAFYGYNAVLVVEGAPEYNKTSYGLTVGANVDIMGSNGSKWTFGLFVPIRSSEFNDHYESVKNDSRIEMKNELMPIAISIGYNFPM